MGNYTLFEPIGYYIAGGSALLSFLIFVSDSGMFLGSLFASLIAAFLIWMSYIIVRLVYLAFKQ